MTIENKIVKFKGYTWLLEESLPENTVILIDMRKNYNSS
jgi:hypothetical protein